MFLAALGEGVVAPRAKELARIPWLEFALDPLPDLFAAPPGGASVKVKDPLLKKRLTDHQIGVGCVPPCVVHSGGIISQT